jgi:hypothetical protein
MNKILAAGVLVSAAAITAHGAGIHARQVRQHGSIAHGISRGSLTPHEAHNLRFREADLRRDIRRDRVDGPGLTIHERERIDKRQDRLARDIYREKHDGQVR